MNVILIEIIKAVAGALGKEVTIKGIQIARTHLSFVIESASELLEKVAGKLRGESQAFSNDFTRFEKDPERYRPVLEDDIKNLIKQDQKFAGELEVLLEQQMRILNEAAKEGVSVGSAERIAIATNSSLSVAGDVGGNVSFNPSKTNST